MKQERKRALAQLEALDASATMTHKAISAKLKRLRHAIRRSIGDEPTTDPEIQVAAKPFGIE